MLELILGLPLLLILLFATVELGLLFSNMQRLEMASRAGASVASQMALPTMDPIPADVLNAINTSLAGSGIVVEKITLEHTYDAGNPGDVGNTVELTTGGNCPDPIFMPPLPVPINRPYARVTICAATDSLAPNCMKMFKFDLSDRVSQQATTLRHEL